jgi:hypothetical protein
VNSSQASFPLDFGFGTGPSFSALFTNVNYEEHGAGPGVDALGYSPIEPASGVTAVVRGHNGTADIATLPVDLAADEVTSFFLAGIFGPGTVVVCHDLAPPVDGVYSDCHSRHDSAPDAGTDSGPGPGADAQPTPDANATGSIVEFPLPNANSVPTDMVLGPDGALWFTEQEAGMIGRITTEGVLKEFPLPLATPDAARRPSPAGISVGPDGALWFSESDVDRIGRITVEGTITTFPLPASKSYSLGTTAGPDGAVWLT